MIIKNNIDIFVDGKKFDWLVGSYFIDVPNCIKKLKQDPVLYLMDIFNANKNLNIESIKVDKRASMSATILSYKNE